MTVPRAMPASPWRQRTIAGALAAYGLFASYSSAGVAISMGVLLLLALARPRELRAAQPWREPPLLIGLLLLAWIALHTLATTGLAAASVAAVNRYHELLVAPVLFVLLREPAHRRLFLQALLAGAVLVALAYWTLRSLPTLHDAFVLHRISAGFALAVGAFIAVQLSRAPGQWRWLGVAAFLAVSVLFAIEGRTGHLALLVLAGYAGWLHAPRRWRWAALCTAPLLLAALAFTSQSVQSRLAESLRPDPVMAAGAEPTSTGIRLELARLALDLSLRHGVAGAGYANYRQVHEEAARQRYAADPLRAHYLQWRWVHAGNPHNEYAMHLVGGGVAALALFLAWLAAILRAGWRGGGTAGAMLVGATLAFALGCAFNSMLMNFVEGHFFIGLLACLLAELRWPAAAHARAPRPAVAGEPVHA